MLRGRNYMVEADGVSTSRGVRETPSVAYGDTSPFPSP